MRLFVALPLSPVMCESLKHLQNDWYNLGIRGNYSQEENLHITLAFIGEYSDPDAVLEALSYVSFTPMPISLDGVGAFGDLWWAGITGSPALEAVCKRVRRSLAAANIPFDKKRFNPHITLLRKASAAKIPNNEIQPASMTVNRLVLYRSDRGRSTMIYTELGSIYATLVK